MVREKRISLFRNWSICLFIAWGLKSSPVRAETGIETQLGLSSRSLNYSISSVGSGAGTGDQDSGKKHTETVSGPQFCERIVTSTGLGLSLAAGGCATLGGAYTFANSTSLVMSLRYFPGSTRLGSDESSMVKLQTLSASVFYLAGIAGITKITHNQVSQTNLTLSTDVLDLGMGAGYSFHLSNHLAIGAEFSYLIGVIMSSATSGSASQFGASLVLSTHL